MKIATGVGGWFKIEKGLCDEHGNPIESTKRVVADWFPNLILDQGLNQLGGIGATSQTLQAAQVGTGTTDPAESQTALASYLVGTSTATSTTSGTSGSPYYYTFIRRTYRFSQGAAAGNLTEVGVGTQAATGGLFSRALILDGSGQSITNGSFDSGDTNWTKGTGWAINNSSGVYFNGLWSAVYTGTGTDDEIVNAGTDGVVEAGKVVTANCRIYAETGKEGCVQIEFLDVSDAVLQTDTGNVVSGGEEWTESTVTATAPVDAVAVRVGARATHDSGTGALYVDEFNWNLTAGEPTTITVLPIEFLDVTYELRQYPPLYDVPFQITIAGDVYDCVMRARNVNSSFGTPQDQIYASGSAPSATAFSGTIGAVTSSPTGSSDVMTTATYTAYVLDDFYATFTPVWSIAAANFNIGAISLTTNRGNFQCSFSPSIPKDNTKELTLTFRVFWRRRLI
jgi:hypothetical protein